jgi:ketosteroid isomerase-like protein
MSQESTTPDPVELRRRMLDAVPRRDFDALMSFYAPDAKWDAPPGIGNFEGAAAIRSFLEDWIGAFEEWGHKHEDGHDLGNGVVFVTLRLDGRPVGSRGRLQERYASTVVWAAGMIVRVMVSRDIDEARAAAERLVESRG